MFLGHHTVPIDSKGRLPIPAGYQPFLATGLVVTAGFDGGLLLLPQANWQVLAERVIQTALTNGRGRSLRRHLFANATLLHIDRNGRIPLPGTLRQLTRMTDQAVVVGLYNYLELWTPARWEQVRTQTRETAVAWEGLPI